MIKQLALACAFLCALTINAEAGKLHPRCNIDWPCAAPSASTPEQVRWARGMYIQRQIGLGGPHVKRAVRAPKANLQGKLAGSIRVATKRLQNITPNITRESAAALYSNKNKSLRGGLKSQLSTFGITSPSIAYTIAKPLRFIAGKLKCALNLNAALAEKGIAGTGSAMAHSFDRWGRASLPVPGAVAVTDRRGGGHVALVSRVEGGRVFVFQSGTAGLG